MTNNANQYRKKPGRLGLVCDWSRPSRVENDGGGVRRLFALARAEEGAGG